MITLHHNLPNDGWHIRLFREILNTCNRPTRENQTDKIKIKGHEYEIKRYVLYQKDNEYRIIDFQEQVNPKRLTIKRLIQQEQVKIILRCMYREGIYQNGHWTKCKPYLYTEKDPEEWQKHLTYLRTGPKNIKKLYFRGTAGFGNRKNVLKRMKNITNKDHRKASLEQYMDEIRNYKIALSLPGVANTCHREIELFGAGVPVLMPTQKTKFYDPLIPNFHYVAVDVDAKQEDNKIIAAKLIQRFSQVIDNDVLLNDISTNAKQWYDRNIAIGNRAEISKRLLGL